MADSSHVTSLGCSQPGLGVQVEVKLEPDILGSSLSMHSYFKILFKNWSKLVEAGVTAHSDYGPLTSDYSYSNYDWSWSNPDYILCLDHEFLTQFGTEQIVGILLIRWSEFSKPLSISDIYPVCAT